MVEDKNDVGRMCERMEISEQDVVLALDRYMQKNDLTFRRFYHKKFHMYFFEMRQPLDEKHFIKLCLGLKENQIQKIELYCFFSFRLSDYFYSTNAIWHFINQLHISNRIGAYGLDDKGFLFCRYTHYVERKYFSPVTPMLCLFDLFEEGEEVFRLCQAEAGVFV